MRGPTALVLGHPEPALLDLLADLFSELDLALAIETSPLDRWALALLVVDPRDLEGDLADARARACGAPVIALLPMDDVRVRRRCAELGVLACCSLDAPLELLRELLRRVLGTPQPSPAR